MSTPPLSCLALLLLYISLVQIPTAASADYPGVIELVGYSNRRARTHFLPSARSGRQLDISTLAPPPAKIQADIETVKQNIEKYNKLLTLDTRNLPESQKDMLERIVERVARLKESLDIEEHAALTQNSTYTNEPTTGNFAPTTESATAIEPETVPTLVLDETTLLQLQTSMDELAAAQAAVTSQTTRMRELPVTTISPELDLEDISAESATEVATDIDLDADSVTDTDTNTDTNSLGASSIAADYGSTTLDSLTDATDADDQFVAARSNNNIAAITAADSDTSSAHTTTAGNQRTLTTSGKLTKTRATKRPYSSATKSSGSLTTLTKRGQRPGSLSTAHYKQTTTKQKVSAAAAAAAAYTTQQPLQYQKQHSKPHQQQQHYQHKLSTVASSPVTSSTPADQRITSGSTAANYGSNNINTNNYNSNYNTNNNNNNNNINNNNNNNNNNDMVYDAHVNTSAIIDSLNSNAREEYYQQKQTVNNKDKKPSATAKPTKYHYYPHNQHIYLLPECAIQQVCNAVYVRLNYTQPLCACPSRYRDPCSASLNEDDQHTTKLIGDGKKKAITLAKTCEATTEMRECRSPKDWSLLALQNTRTGKSHYLVICRCPDHFKMEGPMAHDQPTYASVPGIRVFGMMCVKPGYSVRKPSAQPPKRYQLQKPFYRPQNIQSSSTNSFLSNSQFNNKDNYGRPTYGISNGASSSSSNYHGQDIYSNQHQSGYQYLNRPESSHSSSLSSSNYRPESLSINNFQNGIYGRNNERKGATSIEAATEDDNKSSISTSTLPTEETRTTMTAADSEINSSSSAADLGVTISADSSTTMQSEEIKREKRSLAENTIDLDDDTPEFPWDRVMEFQQTIVWD